MRKSKTVKQPAGNPLKLSTAPGESPFVGVRFSAELMAKIDAWAAKRTDGNRSLAIRRLVELGLKASRT